MIPVKIIAGIICLIFILVNYIGLKESVLLNDLLVTAKVLILLFFVAFGLGFFRQAISLHLPQAGSMGILSGAALIFFAYTGFARVTIMAEEVQDPEKTIPRSIYLALGISTVIYLLVSIVALGLAGALLSHNPALPLRMQSGVQEVLGRSW